MGVYYSQSRERQDGKADCLLASWVVIMFPFRETLTRCPCDRESLYVCAVCECCRSLAQPCQKLANVFQTCWKGFSCMPPMIRWVTFRRKYALRSKIRRESASAPVSCALVWLLLIDGMEARRPHNTWSRGRQASTVPLL